MVFPMFLGYSSVFPKLFHLFSPGVSQPPFFPTEPWNFLIFDSIHRERPNVPDPQVVRGAVLDGESLQLRFESSRKNRGVTIFHAIFLLDFVFWRNCGARF